MTDLETRLRDGLRGDVDQRDVDRLLTDVRRGVAWRRGRRSSAGVALAVVALVGGSVLVQQARSDRTSPLPATFGPSPTATTSVSTPPLPRDATSQVLDVAATVHGALRLTTNIGCLGCSTVWRQASDGHWEHLFDFTGRAAYGGQIDEDFGPVSYLTMAPNGRDGYAWGARLWSTHDGGESWAIVTDGPGGRTVRGHRTVVGPTTAWSAFDGRVLYRSEIGSDTWTLVDPPEIGDVLGVLPDDRVVLMAYPGEGSQGRMVYGAGTSWSELALPCDGGGAGPGERVGPGPVVSGGAAYVVCGHHVERTTLDDTPAWHVLGRISGRVLALLPLDDHRVLVQTRTVSVFDEQGRHPDGLRAHPHQQLMRISSQGVETWVVDLAGSTWRSSDAGRTWVSVASTS